MRASGDGDDLLYRRWRENGEPALLRALRGWGRTQAEADALVQDLLVVVFLAQRRKAPIRDELAWIAGTLNNLWTRGHARRRDSHLQAGDWSRVAEPEARDGDPTAPAGARDDARERRAHILALASRLPRPFGHILVWQGLEGASREEIGRRLRAIRPVSAERVRALIRVSHGLARLCGAGIDLRSAFPQRFHPGKNPWIATPLPPLDGQWE